MEKDKRQEVCIEIKLLPFLLNYPFSFLRCEISSNYLMLYIGYIEMVLADIKRVGFTPDPIKEHLDLVLNDMLSLLEKHLSR